MRAGRCSGPHRRLFPYLGRRLHQHCGCGLSHLLLGGRRSSGQSLIGRLPAPCATWTAGPYSEAVQRSLITLKALTFGPSGGIGAAATTSLPEQIGGPRNWDYRSCWVRDATLTILALMGAGFFDEARAWRDWLVRAVAGSPQQLQIMYAVTGERRLTEWEVPWLAGYENSKPVRIGNAAHTQLQLDVYGELMDALYRLFGWRGERAARAADSQTR